ncbi:MAG: ATP-binding cassette domain-containing protein [Propionibacteriales bacterium]|nr:ATP-binding cassette domain-containing protein [Propionibacteriales bacterium]
MNHVVRMTDVSKSFKGHQVLNGINWQVDPGECCSIQGTNGSGKSVLFKIMCGFVRPDAGVVDIHPDYRHPGKPFPQEFGVIIDRPGYLANRTGRDNLVALARIRDLIEDADIDRALEQVGLDPDLPQKVGNYSLGMKQRLALAQAFMEGQPVLVLDEPFNGLDDATVEQMITLLQRFTAEGRTVIFTSHDSDHVARLAQKRYRLDAGRLSRLETTND